MADHVPLQAPRTKRNFGFGLLNLVFAEQRVAKIRRRPDRLGGMSLGDGDKGDVITIPLRTGAGALDALFDFLPMSGQIHFVPLSILTPKRLVSRGQNGFS